MIEICLKYSKDLGSMPESLLLIEKYKNLFAQADRLKKLEDDCNK